MKKKMLLTIIPALMVLSACAGVAPQKEVAPLFKEDTLAHEELFDDAESIASKLGVKQPLRAASDMVEPQIGVQFKEYTDELDNTKNYCAIRYVAAIASRHVKAEWIRGVSRQDAYALKAKGIKESSVAYTSLSNNGTIIQAANGSCFVVYTLYDIPLFDNGDNKSCYWSYVAAGLKLTDLDGQEQPVMSKVVAVEIGKHHCFSFYEKDLDSNGYFIEGRINGSDNQVVALDGNVGESDNHAVKSLTLKANDIFGVFKWSGSEFKYYGSFDRKYDGFFLEKVDTLSTNYSSVRVDGTYNLYVNSSDMFGLGAVSVTIDLYLDLASYWQNGDEKIAIYYIKDSSFHAPTEKISNSLYRFNINVGEYPSFIFVRSDKTLAEGTYNWWNQTQDIVFNDYNVDTNPDGSILRNKFTLTGWSNDGGKSGYIRSVYVPAE